MKGVQAAVLGGSALVLLILALRLTLKDHLPRRLFPALWCTAAIRFLLPVEIPKTSVTSNKAAEFATVYDIQKYEGAVKTYKRALDAYDRFVDLVEESLVEAWRARRTAV